MTNESIIETLSTLPQRFLLNMALTASVAKTVGDYDEIQIAREQADAANAALEMKQANLLRGMDTIDIDCQFV